MKGSMGRMVVKFDIPIIQKRDCFKYIGSMIQGYDEIKGCHPSYWCRVGEMMAHIQILKGKFYRMTIRLDMLYGMTYWLIKNSHTKKMKVVEMRIL